MHGRIFWELRAYTEATYGDRSWRELLKIAGVEEKVYLGKAYPDTEMVELVGAAAKLGGKSVPELLEDFGAFLSPHLLTMYGHLIKQEWRTLELIEHAERVGHSTVRQQEAGTAPPFLRVKRLGAEKVVLIYSSPRKLCALAVGMIKGLGKHFNEEVSVQHTTCMHRGAAACEIVVRSFSASLETDWLKAKSQTAGD
jgi:predicted hydrocarbon binding protein